MTVIVLGTSTKIQQCHSTQKVSQSPPLLVGLAISMATCTCNCLHNLRAGIRLSARCAQQMLVHSLHIFQIAASGALVLGSLHLPPFIIKHENNIKHANVWCCGMFQGETPVPMHSEHRKKSRCIHLHIAMGCMSPPKCDARWYSLFLGVLLYFQTIESLGCVHCTNCVVILNRGAEFVGRILWVAV